MKKVITIVVGVIIVALIGFELWVAFNTIGYNNIQGVKQTLRNEDRVVAAKYDKHYRRWEWHSYKKVIGNRYKDTGHWGLSAVDAPMTDVFDWAWESIYED